jgi:molybdate transport system substrate-binding protein
MHINPRFPLIAILLCLLAGQGAACAQARPELIVSAAVSLKDAFTKIGRRFEAKEGAVVTFNFGASSLLQRQIETGAPADVFASAAEIQMDRLAQQHLILPDSRKNFACNTLVLIVPGNSRLKAARFQDLGTAAFSRIALGSPGVPVRLYSEEALRMLNVWERVLPKCVFGENARQVLDYVARGEVDAGLVYATDAALMPKVRVAAVADSAWHRPILYPVAVVADSRQPDLARRFIAYLTGKEGQDVLKKYGFTVP